LFRYCFRFLRRGCSILPLKKSLSGPRRSPGGGSGLGRRIFLVPCFKELI
jgi:hypothetical protein